MHPPDENKTTFITDRGIYCYKVMPFRLKNAGATFQWMVNSELIEHTMEVYVDDMFAIIRRSTDHVQHLSEAFNRL